jgi:hypothetical protein
MRGYIDTVARAIPGRHRHDDERRMPRRMRPRATRSTFVPLREASIVRGLSRAA